MAGLVYSQSDRHTVRQYPVGYNYLEPLVSFDLDKKRADIQMRGRVLLRIYGYVDI